MYMILFVLDDAAKLDKVLDAWEKIEIRGVTIFESTGINRHKGRKKAHIPIPMRYVFQPAADSEENGNLTLMTIVDNEETITSCIEVTETIVGPLDQPDTGVLAAWPLTNVRGVPPSARKESD